MVQENPEPTPLTVSFDKAYVSFIKAHSEGSCASSNSQTYSPRCDVIFAICCVYGLIRYDGNVRRGSRTCSADPHLEGAGAVRRAAHVVSAGGLLGHNKPTRYSEVK